MDEATQEGEDRDAVTDKLVPTDRQLFIESADKSQAQHEVS